MDRIVIVGGGQAGQEAASSLRSGGYGGEITIVGAEPHMPYQRPPLSKAYLHGTMEETELHLETPASLVSRAISFLPGDPAVRIDRTDRLLALASGKTLRYDHLILATGTRPRPLPANLAGTAIVALRSLDHANHLRQRLSNVRHVVVIGAGFIGLEFAAIAAGMGIGVDIVEREPHVMARVSSTPVALACQRHHESLGTRFHLGRSVVNIGSKVVLDDGTALDADLVLAAIGVVPNEELAAESGLACNNGIVVDDQLLTSDPHISAIGDCAIFPSGDDRHVRLESVQNAVDHGGFVARRLLGSTDRYAQLPLFWTDQSGLRLQIAGLPRPNDDLITRGDTFGTFSVFHLQSGQLTAVESINRPGDHMAARTLLKAGVTPTADQIIDLGTNLRDLALHAS